MTASLFAKSYTGQEPCGSNDKLTAGSLHNRRKRRIKPVGGIDNNILYFPESGGTFALFITLIFRKADRTE